MRKLRITIGNKSYDVTVEDLTEEHPYQSQAAAAATPPANAPAPIAAPAPAAAAPAPAAPSEAGAVTSPMAGAILSVLVKEGDTVTAGQTLVVLEAMKMENKINAPTPGTIQQVNVAVGDSVREGHVLVVVN